MNVEAFLFELPMQAKIVAAFLLLLFFAFLVFYILPGVAQWVRLRKVIRQLRGLKVKTPAEFGKIFQSSKRLKHLWQEYQETLHPQKGAKQRNG